MRLQISVRTISLLASLLGLSEIGHAQIPQQATDGYIRQFGFDVLHYQLHVEVSDTNNVIHGKTIITVRRLDPLTIRLGVSGLHPS